MKKIFGFFKQGWFLTLVGILALSAMIWYVGGMYDGLASPINRLIAMGSLFAVWAFYYLVKSIRARRRNQQMMDKLAEDPEPQASPDEIASQEEVAQLDNNLQEALQALKDRKLGDDGKGGKQYVYELPWYAIIGPPGSGKTTLLGNSDLHFPLSERFGKDALRGVGGTRNCDWWFTNEAVLLDTAGRYTTQDSNQQVDQSAWFGFLELLKEHRSHQPLNGVMVAVSIADLLEQSEVTREKHAQTIRQRIDELYEHLGIKIPVYLMLTKMDLLAGFTEFFDDMNREQREQVWGMTFPASEKSNEDIYQLFGGEFSLLEDRINGQLLTKLEKERSQERRQALYLFPQQFSSMKNILNDFIQDIFQSSNFHQAVIFRGVYFTSATQEGSPIDRIMGAVANSFGMPRQQLASFSGQGKGFFINRLLKDVIFSESGLAGTDRKLEKRLQWLQTGTAIAAGLAVIMVAGLWFFSYQANREIVRDYGVQVATLVEQAKAMNEGYSLQDQLPFLEEIRQLTDSYADAGVKPGYSLMEHLGLYQGKSLRQEMDDQYIGLLGIAIRPHAKNELEVLLSSSGVNLAQKFQLLKTYLYLGNKVEKDVETPRLASIDWDNNGKPDDQTDELLSKHFNNLLEHSSVHPIQADDELIASTRGQLSNADIGELVYTQLKTEALVKTKKFDFRLHEKPGLKTIDVSFEREGGKSWSEGIPGLFTKAGFREFFYPAYKDFSSSLEKDAWVLGDADFKLDDRQSIQTRILREYQKDYVTTWKGFLNDMRVRSLPMVPMEAAEVLRGLSPEEENLLKHIFVAVKEETSFSKDNELPGIGNVLEIKKVLDDVELSFEELHKLVEEGDKELAKVTGGLDTLFKDLYKDVGDEDNKTINDTLKNLYPDIQGLPEIPRKWLEDALRQAEKIVNKEQASAKTAAVVTAMNEQFCKPCKEHFKKKFPFHSKAKANVEVAKFTEFFSMGGILDSFKKSELEDTESINKTVLKRMKKISADGDRLRRVFFSGGGLGFQFSLRLTAAAPDVQSVKLSIGSASHTFSATSGVREPKIFAWPMSPASGKVVFKDQAEYSFELAKAKNAWDLIKHVRNDQLKIPGQGNVVFKVDTASLKESPFMIFNTLSRDLKECRCPGNG